MKNVADEDAPRIQVERIYTIQFRIFRWTKILEGFNYYLDGKCVNIDGSPAIKLNPAPYSGWKHFLWALDGRRYGYAAERR